MVCCTGGGIGVLIALRPGAREDTAGRGIVNAISATVSCLSSMRSLPLPEEDDAEEAGAASTPLPFSS